MLVRDLSQPIRTDMPVFPGDPAVTIDPHAKLETDGYRVSTVHMGTHSGTHVDAPSHTEPDGKSIDEFPVDAFQFDAHRIDCRGLDPREAISPSLPTNPPDVDLVVFETGWDAHWGEARYLDHPYLAPDVADWCGRYGYSVAIDALNPDPTPTGNVAEDEPDGFPVHHAVLGDGNLIIENLAGLDDLPARFELRALPLPITGGDGAPARAVAVTPE